MNRTEAQRLMNRYGLSRYLGEPDRSNFLAELCGEAPNSEAPPGAPPIVEAEEVVLPPPGPGPEAPPPSESSVATGGQG